MAHHNPRRRAVGRARLEVQLHSKPRDYVPGCAPRLEPPSLLPAKDSTAYIVDRILLPSPGHARDGRPLPKRMTYIVGWQDLPAARILVPAMKVLDYVSPRDLENWEGEMEEDLERQRAKLYKDRDHLAELAPAKKRKGRPPVHTGIETAITAEVEDVDAVSSRHKPGALSLSTPQKTRLSDLGPDMLLDDADDAENDSEDSPSRQLEADIANHAKAIKPGVIDGVETFRDQISRVGIKSASPTQQSQRIDTFGRMSLSSLPSREREASQVKTSPNAYKSPFQTDERYRRPSSSHFSLRPSPPQRPPSARASLDWALPPKSRDNSILGSTAAVRTPKIQGKSQGDLLGWLKPGNNSTKAALPLSKTQQPEPREPVGEMLAPSEADWEVKRLEDMELYEVEGRGLVRYFRVRWEGNWPADQNPSWEPEENLPRNLVRNYLKSRKRENKAGGASTSKSQISKSMLRNQLHDEGQGSKTDGGHHNRVGHVASTVREPLDRRHSDHGMEVDQFVMDDVYEKGRQGTLPQNGNGGWGISRSLHYTN